MNNALVTLLCDAGLAVLLTVTIGYCARLSKRIRLLQDSRSELGEMISRFDQATGRAVASLSELQTVSKKITEALQIKIEKANFLADDLAFLIEKSTKLSGQKEPAKTPQAEPVKPSAQSEPRPYFETPQPSFERQPTKARPAATPPQNAYSSAASISSIEAVLQRLSVPGGMASPSPSLRPPAAANAPAARTGAERELLEALKSGR